MSESEELAMQVWHKSQEVKHDSLCKVSSEGATYACECQWIRQIRADERKLMLGNKMNEIAVGDVVVILPAAVFDE